MAEILAEGLDIRYGHRVTSMRWSGDGVDVACSSGEEFHADAVIVTVSLGVLKASPMSLLRILTTLPYHVRCRGRHAEAVTPCPQEEHSSLFQPPLPHDKVEAIGKLGMGIVDKIFITFHGVPKGKHPHRSVLSYQLLWKVRLLSLLKMPTPAAFELHILWQH